MKLTKTQRDAVEDAIAQALHTLEALRATALNMRAAGELTPEDLEIVANSDARQAAAIAALESLL